MDTIAKQELNEEENTHTPLVWERGRTTWKVAGETNQGKRRENNEDNFQLAPEENLFVVCDGMGGMAMGELASAHAVGAIVEWFSEHATEVAEARGKDDATIAELLKESLVHANQVLQKMVEEKPHWSGMGTTVVLGYRVEDKLHLANAGDSRAYLLRGQEPPTLLTTDDSIAASLLRRREMTEAEARASPLRNQLTSALGELSKGGSHHTAVELQPGDRVLLCSDGLWDMVEDAEIAHLTREATTPQEAVERLIQQANDNGGHDNITVIALFAQKNPLTATTQSEEEIPVIPLPEDFPTQKKGSETPAQGFWQRFTQSLAKFSTVRSTHDDDEL